MTTASPPAHYRAVEGALASGFATSYTTCRDTTRRRAAFEQFLANSSRRHPASEWAVPQFLVQREISAGQIIAPLRFTLGTHRRGCGLLVT
ncbi:hypothetical protein QO004_002819 [Rhizobium mesoamericanum]|nr:hypothetical protein [Rhizobium mesoamericanum]